MRRHDGHDFWCALSIKAIDEGALDRGSIWIFEDVTQRRITEEQLRRMANYDVLTELPNRSLFHDRLRHAIQHARRREQKLALLFLDLDHFKHINDSLGHSAGDELLCDVARRLSQCIRQDDTVARLGGDEFTIILETIDDTDAAALVAQKIIDVLASPCTLEGHEINISPSIGISIYPDDGTELDGLLRSADAAMYHAKACGRNTYQFYSDELNAAASERVKLMSSLRKALDQDAFSLVYQPLVRIGDDRILGFEALLRWQHPEWGVVTPDRFIPLLEETGLIVPVGLWVLRKACSDCRDLFGEDIKLSVNLSGRQFRDAGLPQQIAAILEDTGMAADRLELEITETVLMSDTENAVQAMDRLHELGVRLSIDDFGTGYSSLAYLKRFPIDTVKVDRSFIRDISTDADDAAIVEAILAMTRRLGLETIAEGVETNEQLAFLRRNQCDYAQGFLFSRPVGALEAAGLLPEKSDDTAQAFARHSPRRLTT
jgi:diguanylate cyclase (GGDEF)-like protein